MPESFDAIKESFSNNLIKEGFTPKNIILEKVVLENGVSSEINNRHLIIHRPVLKCTAYVMATLFF